MNPGDSPVLLESAQPDSVGSLYLALEQLKAKPSSRSGFALKQPRRFSAADCSRYQPKWAVIRDIVTTLKRRYPHCPSSSFPTRVQGKEASSECRGLWTAQGQAAALTL